MSKRIERLPEVMKRTGKSRSAIYQGVSEGTFPAPVKLGPRAVGWISDSIDAWIESRPMVRHDAEAV